MAKHRNSSSQTIVKPDITMFADASVHLQNKSCGWGFWIKGDNRQSISACGPILNFHPVSDVSELKAISFGLLHAESVQYFRDRDQTIMIQTDSTEALKCLLFVRPDTPVNQHHDSAPVARRRKNLCKTRSEIIRQIFAILDRQALKPVLRHVRGHKSGGGRNWVNRHCDKLAKEGRREAERLAEAYG